LPVFVPRDPTAGFSFATPHFESNLDSAFAAGDASQQDLADGRAFGLPSAQDGIPGREARGRPESRHPLGACESGIGAARRADQRAGDHYFASASRPLRRRSQLPIGFVSCSTGNQGLRRPASISKRVTLPGLSP
jgi:hypothetical protein